MTLEENEGNENVSRAASSKEIDLEAGKDNQDQTEVAVEKPKRKWFQKRKKEEEEEVVEKSVPYFQLFRYASSVDKLLMVIGSIFGIANGASMPLMMLIFGDLTDSFISFTQSGPAAINISAISGCSNVSLVNTATNTSITAVNTSIASQGLEDSVHRFMIYFIILACAVLVVSYLQISSWVIVSERQTYQIRVNFFKSIMRQDIGWFDTHKSGELITRLSDDINKIHDGIGDKAAIYCQWMAACIAGFTMGFVRGWKLTLVIIAISPLLAIVAAFMSKLGSAFTNKELEAYSKAGGVAEEILSSVRTVVSFGGEKKACERYDGQLDHALRVGIKKSFVVGIGIALTFVVMFGSYALAFWYGSTLIAAGEMSGGTILTVFFSVMIGAMSLGHAAPCVENFANAKGAGAVVFEIIDTIPPIDASSDEGEKPSNVTGDIQLRNINFTYPARKDVQVLKNFNLNIKHGQTLALVGGSGCGKSTVVQLIQRFYDPQDGCVEIDGCNIKTLNVSWLRQNIGIVSQEPCLFATTIKENIRNGNESASDEDITKAAQNANAYDFIKALPKGFDTMVGERGAQLSGGQKQRIAIARALVKNPKILLLDEATSALDNESEAIVQAALDKAREGRTTIVIAHRLSTVRNANVLAALQDGAVAELGTHDELMDVKGIYYELVTNQTFGKSDDNEDEEEIAQIDEIADLKNASFRAGSPKVLDNSKRGRQSSVSKQLSRQFSSKSASSDVQKEEEEKEDLPPVSFLKIMRLNKDELGYIFIGTLGAIGQGSVMPVFAILFSEIIAVFAECDPVKRESDATFWSLMFLVLGSVSGISVFLQTLMYGISGEYMTKRLRSQTFRAILKQEIGWFDEQSHTTGALCNRLATDASEVKGATGTRLGAVIQSIVSMVAALVIAFVYGWKLALVILGCVPFIVVSGAIQMRVFIGGAKKNKDAADKAAEVSTEALENIRTVESLNLENKIIAAYTKNLKVMLRKSLIQAHVYGLAYGFSQAVIFFTYAAAFRFGAFLVANNQMNFADMFKVFSAIVFGALSLGQTSSFVPDYSKAKQSAARLFAILERESKINVENEGGERTNENDTTIKFENVNFNYPTRPTIPVLDGITFKVKPGQTIALVGTSGCGKSTSVALLERFYDTASGSVTVGGKEIRNINIKWLRSLMGIVQQEPILFNTTIAENISYGDNSRALTRDEIITAAKSANIHDFIQGLPESYETLVGEKGTQMSGGQKQRIAIARALVRKPRILLLDEATSALDTESEKIVQAALDKAREGRTCIVIAHRLSTIRNADGIAVFQKGKIIEFGTHDELIAKEGVYFKLQNTQV